MKGKLIKGVQILTLPIAAAGVLLWAIIKTPGNSDDIIERYILVGFFLFFFPLSVFMKGHIHDINRGMMDATGFDKLLSLSHKHNGPFSYEETYSIFRILWYLTLLSLASFSIAFNPLGISIPRWMHSP